MGAGQGDAGAEGLINIFSSELRLLRSASGKTLTFDKSSGAGKSLMVSGNVNASGVGCTKKDGLSCAVIALCAG
jgi:hypothetical protein